MSAMRALHVIASISPARGGPSIAVRNVVEALRRRGISADIATTDDDGPSRRAPVDLGGFVELHGQRVRYFPKQTSFYAISLPLLRWLIAHVRDYDVVHTHGLYTFAPIAAAMVARAARVPYVMRPAGMLDRWGLKHRRRFVKRASIRFVEGPLLRRAARVHFVSEHEHAQATELGLRMRPLLLPLGLDLESVTRAASDSTARSTVLYLSRIDRMKGIDALLEAFALVVRRRPDARLVIAGDGPGDLVRSLEQRATALGLNEYVRWPGFVQGAEKAALLKAADVFVLPSRSENFGVAVAEAMAAGLPVIVTDGIGMSGLVARSASGIVTNGSAQALAAAIEQLLADPALRARMGTAGRGAVDEHLSLDAFGGHLEALYRSLA
jgi:glycosyltransferase involved in cell wall biosynthesis